MEASRPRASNFFIKDPKVSSAVISIVAFSLFILIDNFPSALRVESPQGLSK